MAQKSNRFERFWKELKRRKVVQVVTTYIAIAFGILQLVDIVTQPLNLPAVTLKYLIITLCIGLLVVTMFSWIYDITSSGVKKTGSLDSIESEKETPIPKQSNTWKIISYISIAVIIILISLNIINWSNKEDLSKLEKSIALLPFRNDTPVDSNKYFIIGVVEAIRNHLQTIGDLMPISRTSAEKYSGTTKTIPEIAKELGVNYIVEGSAQRSANKLQLNVHLFRTPKEKPLWAKSYEKLMSDASDIFKLQSQIAEAIAGEIEAAVAPKEKQLIEKIPTQNLDAYDAWMKGNFYMDKLTQKGLETGLKYYELAKELDPGFALAYDGISSAWLARQIMGYVSPEEALPKQKEAVMKAVALDSTLYRSLSGYYTWGMFDWENGEKEFKKAIEINPHDVGLRGGYSALLIILGRNEEALKQINVALNLDPLDVWIKAIYGNVLTSARRYPEAIKAYQSALRIDPNYPLAQGNLVWALFLSGKYKEAVEQNKLSCGNDTELVKALEQGYKQGGFKGAQLSYAKVIELRFKNSYWDPFEIAGTYAGIGEKDKALYWLEQAYSLHDPNLPWLLCPVYDNLRDDPRFQDLCKRMKLPYK